ncbi:MAG: GNAT family N-acetyltransferase [Bauldia sp.]|nr:GNAT family N-acetyltransferase [Bauldia sp.]
MTELVTERLVLRRWREEDREPFAAMNADPEVMRYFPSPLSRGESDASYDRMVAAFDRDGFTFFAVDERAGSRFVGLVGIRTLGLDDPLYPAVEIGWRLISDVWRRGYATEAARRSIAFAWEVGLRELLGFTAALNQPSQRVFAKLGFARAAADDFDHPRIEPGHALQPHMAYRLANPGQADPPET